MTGLLVTGTDTGVGKTLVTCALAVALVRRGFSISVWKPVETGWTPSAESTSDAERLRRAAGSDEPLEAICPYRLKAPLAPSVAARLEGTVIDMEHLVEHYRERARCADLVLVEGAGGLLVPLDGRETYADLARTCGCHILIVAANRLGTINHTALTVRVATAEGLHTLGFVLNDVGGAAPPAANEDASIATNRATIVELTGLRCLGEIPYDSDLPATPERAARHVDVDHILARL